MKDNNVSKIHELIILIKCFLCFHFQYIFTSIYNKYIHMYIYLIMLRTLLVNLYLSSQTALINFCYILSLAEIQLFWYPCHMLPVGKLDINSVHFLLTENIKRSNQGIFLLGSNKNINIDGINVIFLQDKTQY